jgi:hypothetical protein
MVVAALASAADVSAVWASAIDSGAPSVTALRLTKAPTPRFRVAKYDTHGVYAQVDGTGDLRRVNAALRRIITSDQRAYVKSARRAARDSGSSVRGTYGTWVDAGTVSASTIVVSVLMRANRVFPGGTKGGDVVSGTVLVPSGRRIGVTRLFTEPTRALTVLAREFKRAYLRQNPTLAACLDYVRLRPTAENLRHFALLPDGMAVGSGAGICTWVIATVPYDRLRPHFSELARKLIEGVRSPASAP